MQRNIFLQIAFIFVFVTFFSSSANAQLTRKFSHNFMVADAASIVFEAQDSIVYEAWGSGTLLIETTIVLTGASPAILEHVVRNGRYEYNMEENGDKVVMKPLHANRQPIIVKGQPVVEQAILKVFYPDAFVLNAAGRLEKREE